MDLTKIRKVFLVGIKGVAMANLACILTKMGKTVVGSDIEEEFITDKVLKKLPIKILVGFNPSILPDDTQAVVYSAAHQGIANPIVKLAIKKKIKVISQAKLITLITNYFSQLIAVCGCHGKTTTASLIAFCLIKLSAELGYLVGAPEFNNYPGGDYRGTKVFVLEADEYGVSPPYDRRPKLLFFQPNYAVCTNIDYDHPDIYQNIEQVKQTFFNFFLQVKERLIVCYDNLHIRSILLKIKRERYITYGFKEGADVKIISTAIKDGTTEFYLKLTNRKSFNSQTIAKLKSIEDIRWRIRLSGKKNISNVTAAIIVLRLLNYSSRRLVDILDQFSGATRRFEMLYKNNQIGLLDDYAHHPAEIEATIQAARSRFPNQQIIVIFQPHTFSRTAALLKEFSNSLAKADFSYILPIYPSARENPGSFDVSHHSLVTKDVKHRLLSVDSPKEVIDHLPRVIKGETIIITMGAGDVYKLKPALMKIAKKYG